MAVASPLQQPISQVVTPKSFDPQLSCAVIGYVSVDDVVVVAAVSAGWLLSSDVLINSPLKTTQLMSARADEQCLQAVAPVTPCAGCRLWHR